MPALSYEALGVLFILLPGFLTAEIVRILSTRPERTEFDKVLHAFIYSFLIYICFAASKSTFPISLQVEGTPPNLHYSIEPHFRPLIGLFAISVLLGVLVGVALNYDFPLRLLRKLGFTQKTLQVTVWNDTFQTFGGYVQVEFMDGRMVMGWLRLFSDTPEESSLFLEDAAWLKGDGEKVWIKGPGILLTKQSGIRNILFLDAVKDAGQEQDDGRSRPGKESQNWHTIRR
jgi:Family of unknown function (DUF6338)